MDAWFENSMRLGKLSNRASTDARSDGEQSLTFWAFGPTLDTLLRRTSPVTEMTKEIPKEWDVKREALDALADLVVGRATFVAETITSRIWPQGSLFFEDEAGSPEN